MTGHDRLHLHLQYGQLPHLTSMNVYVATGENYTFNYLIESVALFALRQPILRHHQCDAAACYRQRQPHLSRVHLQRLR